MTILCSLSSSPSYGKSNLQAVQHSRLNKSPGTAISEAGYPHEAALLQHHRTSLRV